MIFMDSGFQDQIVCNDPICSNIKLSVPISKENRDGHREETIRFNQVLAAVSHTQGCAMKTQAMGITQTI